MVRLLLIILNQLFVLNSKARGWVNHKHDFHFVFYKPLYLQVIPRHKTTPVRYLYE